MRHLYSCSVNLEKVRGAKRESKCDNMKTLVTMWLFLWVSRLWSSVILAPRTGSRTEICDRFWTRHILSSFSLFALWVFCIIVWIHSTKDVWLSLKVILIWGNRSTVSEQNVLLQISENRNTFAVDP